jgi:chitinase
VINGHFYWYQEEWSNDTQQCLQRYTRAAKVPTATFTAKAGSGLKMTFNATGSTTPGGVADYSWQWNAVTNAPTVETTNPTIGNTFPAAGDYSIGLAVFGQNGQSRGMGGIIETGRNGFKPGFTVSPSSPATGQRVKFMGLATVSRHPITNYLWEFGDGSTGSGRSPKHTYTHPGTYKVEVVQFSGVGSAFPGSGAAPISVEKIKVH